MSKKTVIHELLAVENSLSADANHVQKECYKTLSDKRQIFGGLMKSHQIFAEDQQHLQQPTDHKEVVSTVDAQLDYLAGELTRYWDVSLQKESANQYARADITVDGKVLAKDVAATVLLAMEKRLTSLVSVYNAIPTLDAAKAWIEASDQARKDIFQTKHAIERFQTKTEDEYVTVVKATDKHPAQVVKQTKETHIGKYITTEYSGCLASADKAERIQRLTKLIRAVKQARQRANTQEVNTDLKFGDALFAYVNNG